MLIDIDKIVVGDRIRKDFGDIEELAEDIKENTLLNALVVTPSGNGDGTYLLIAGERRLRACKMLGYKAVPVNTVGVDDAEQALMMEISENECRKEFTKTERLEYARRLAQLEKAKSEQGKRTDLAQDVVQGERNRAANAVAQALGTNRETLRQEQFIADNADMLDPADFADWDEGKLSTNKAYQRIKAAKEQAERERDDARDEIAALEKQNDELYELANTQQVVEREVVREVAPKDYEDVKRRVRELEGSNRLYADDNRSLRKQLKEAQSNVYDHERIMDAARLEADVFRRKYSELSELADVIAAIDQFLSA
jgi:ParB family chromosome partitioning protein